MGFIRNWDDVGYVLIDVFAIVLVGLLLSSPTYRSETFIDRLLDRVLQHIPEHIRTPCGSFPLRKFLKTSLVVLLCVVRFVAQRLISGAA